MNPFHDDLRVVARVLPRGTVGPRTLPLFRRMEKFAGKARAGVEEVVLGACSVRLHRPPARNGVGPALLWIHGGGYVIGTAAQDDAVCAYLAREVGVLVAAVDYRLAPEYPFPTPLHDCYDALAWLVQRDDVDETRVAIGGASAGGGLAAGLALLARDRDEIHPALQLLSYPMLDDRTVDRSVDERHVRLWNNRCNRFGWSSYLGAEPGGADVSALASPARATDLSGLAPAWIGVGTLDLFADEDLAYAQALQSAGVACDTHVVPGAFHGFDSVAPKAGVTRQFRERQAAALRAALS